MVSIEVEFIEGPLDYNLLMCCTWVYAMAAVIWTYFHRIAFPHKGGIVAIDQLTFLASDFHVTRSVLLVGETLHSYQHVRVGLLRDSSLMGTFSLPPPRLLNRSSSLATECRLTPLNLIMKLSI